MGLVNDDQAVGAYHCGIDGTQPIPDSIAAEQQPAPNLIHSAGGDGMPVGAFDPQP
jgi:hypothetical protein